MRSLHPEIDDHDPVTGEYLFMGKWYDHYPAEEIERFEEQRDLAMDLAMDKRSQE